MKTKNRIFNIVLFLLVILSIFITIKILPYIMNVLKYLIKLLSPFIIAFILAYLLQPIVVLLQKLFKKRLVCVIITVVFFFVGLFLFFYYTIPLLIEEINEISNNSENIISSIEDIINKFARRFSFLPRDSQPTFENIRNFLFTYVFEKNIEPSKILNTVIDYLGVIVVIPMTLIYFLLDYEKIISYIRDKLIKNDYIHLKEYLKTLNKTLSIFIKTTFVIMIIVFFIASLSFFIVGLDYPILFALIVAITNIIPYFGPYIGGMIPTLYALTTSLEKAIIIIIIIFIIQLIENNIISPYLHGKNNEVHPILVVLSLVVAGNIFGLVGMIIAVPLLSIIKITLIYYPIRIIRRNDIEKYEDIT